MADDNDPKMAPRFMGIPTFMRTPLQQDPSGLDIALAGVPYDGGVSNRPGARHGPEGIPDGNRVCVIRALLSALTGNSCGERLAELIGRSLRPKVMK